MDTQSHSETNVSSLSGVLKYRLLSLKLNWISNHLLWESKVLYQSLHVKMQPKWISVLSTLEKYGDMGVTDIAKALDLQHPSINAIIKDLKKVGYVELGKDDGDLRRRIISFTDSGKEAYQLADPIWQVAESVLSEIIDDRQEGFMDTLDHIIDMFKSSSYSARVIKRLKEQA